MTRRPEQTRNEFIVEEAARCLNIPAVPKVLIRKAPDHKHDELTITYPASAATHANLLDARSFIRLERAIRSDELPGLSTLWAGFKGDKFIVWGLVNFAPDEDLLAEARAEELQEVAYYRRHLRRKLGDYLRRNQDYLLQLDDGPKIVRKLRLGYFSELHDARVQMLVLNVREKKRLERKAHHE